MKKAEPELFPARLSKVEFEKLAQFRYQLRRFQRFSENVTRRSGITVLQYLLLLQIKGYPGRDWATVGELAERLQAKHHGIVSLISRCEALGLVERCVSQIDRRRVEVRTTKAGARIVEKVARIHRDQLMSLRDQFFVPDLDAFTRGQTQMNAGSALRSEQTSALRRPNRSRGIEDAIKPRV